MAHPILVLYGVLFLEKRMSRYIRKTQSFAFSPASFLSNAVKDLISSSAMSSVFFFAARYLSLFLSNQSLLLFLLSFFRKSIVDFCIMMKGIFSLNSHRQIY